MGGGARGFNLCFEELAFILFLILILLILSID